MTKWLENTIVKFKEDLMRQSPVLQHRTTDELPHRLIHNRWSLTIMPHSADCPQGRSQDFTFSRRGLLQRLASVVLPFLVPRVQPKHGQSPFAIGDKVADYWIDEFEIEQIEYGEVMGVCWHPREQAWAYLVDWTHGTMPPYAYPCFDGHLLIGGDLRLVGHE